MKIGAPRVFTLSPVNPAFMKSSENAVEATIPPIKLLTVQLWETLVFFNQGIEADLQPYCGLPTLRGWHANPDSAWFSAELVVDCLFRTKNRLIPL